MSAARIVATFLLVPALAIAWHICNYDLAAPQSVSSFRSVAAAVVLTTTIIAVDRITEWFLGVPDRHTKGLRNRL